MLNFVFTLVVNYLSSINYYYYYENLCIKEQPQKNKMLPDDRHTAL